MERHRNNVGLLRLIFASLVIVGHAPEQIDGDRHRQPLTMLFHTLSVGELSVDAFFLISGYLITQSIVRTPHVIDYLERRIFRIYPAFIIAFLLSFFAFGPFLGAKPLIHPVALTAHMLLLQMPPTSPGQLFGLPYPGLNGSMWTIMHEFRCYLLVAALGLFGLLRRRWVIAALTAMLVLATIVGTFAFARHTLDRLGDVKVVSLGLGSPWDALRLTAVFMLGSTGFLYRPWLERNARWRTAAVATLAAMALMLNGHTAEMGLAIAGGIALYWLSFRARLEEFQKVNDKWDISYGVYLYGWPIATTILWYNREIAPIELAAATHPLALAAGAASWWLVEKWTKDLKPTQSLSVRTRFSIGVDPRGT